MITAPEKVLIVKINRLGDTVNFLPTLKAIREKWTKSHLTLLTTDIGKELVEGTNMVDELWVVNSELRTFRGFLRWLKIVRRNRFDIGIASSDSSSFIALLFFLSSIPTRVGFTNPKLSFLFNHKIRFSAKITNLELNLQIAKILGLPFNYECPFPDISIPEKDKMELSEKLIKNRIPVDSLFAILHVCSRKPSYRWFVEGYAEVVRFLAEEYSMKTVCVGEEEEKKLVYFLQKLVKSDYIVDLCCETNIKQLVYVISLAKLYVGHSSGPLHIAYMLGIPTVSLWGASSIAIWGPAFDKEKHICIKADLDCFGCEQAVCPKGTLECMESIKTEKVIQEISKLNSLLRKKPS